MIASDKRNHPRHIDRLLGLIALIIIIISWFIGKQRAERNIMPYLQQAVPQARFLEALGEGSYAAWEDESKSRFLGFVTTGTADGFGGELKTVVAVDSSGSVQNLVIVEHKETASFFRRVESREFPQQLIGKRHSDAFVLEQDIQGVTGATYTTRALAESIRKASRKITSSNLGLDAIPEPSPPIQFGLPEILLIVLFIVGFFGRSRMFKHTKALRWISMITGLLFLGFIFNKPLNLTIINKLLMGYWPQWQLHLYWYLLIVGIVFIYNKDNKNAYCEWFCPFGAAQECLGLVGGAKVRTPDRLRAAARWLQRILALSAVIIALIYRNPSASSYEVFSTLFHLIGANWQFALLAIILVASLFLRRPWCMYLCPLRPVGDYIRMMRNWIKETWGRLQPSQIG